MSGNGTDSASGIYIASAEGDSGKSTVALGVLVQLAATGGRVGVFRPISRAAAGEHDYILDLLIDYTSVDVPYADCIGVTYDDVHADPDSAIAEIVTRYHAVAARCDNVLILGSDYTDVASPSELSYNARIAANLSAPVLLVVKAADRTPAEVRAMVEMLMSDIRQSHASVAGVVANRTDPRHVVAVAAAVSDAGCRAWALPEEPLLFAPTMAELATALGAIVYSGDEELLNHEAIDVMVGGMTVEHILERLNESMAVIAPADRSDVLLALVNANAAQGFPRLAGIILNGGLKPHPMIDALVKGLHPTLPILQCEHGTYETARICSMTRGRVAAGSIRKIDVALALMEQYMPSADLFTDLKLPAHHVVTPQMFEYQLLAQAKSDVQHIVLPEGDDDRILRAAGRLLRRGVARLTILGHEGTVRRRA
ncbi:MAG: phosphate acyltransferase, partial [Gordonia sp. (in: high G+C Gram-positive bacteria)]|uniref:phosphotransacetylase family protein n=1 Tax=Gordonia sp. (in: high G+C Gram-positive bacteria) TaxID=84139 RepID=UPI003BB77D84